MSGQLRISVQGAPSGQGYITYEYGSGTNFILLGDLKKAFLQQAATYGLKSDFPMASLSILFCGYIQSDDYFQIPLSQNLNHMVLKINPEAAAQYKLDIEAAPKTKVLAFNISETLRTFGLEDDGYGQLVPGGEDVDTYYVMNGGIETANMLVKAQKSGIRIVLLTNSGEEFWENVRPFFENYGVHIEKTDYLFSKNQADNDKIKRLISAAGTDGVMYFDNKKQYCENARLAGICSVYVTDASVLQDGITKALSPQKDPQQGFTSVDDCKQVMHALSLGGSPENLPSISVLMNNYEEKCESLYKDAMHNHYFLDAMNKLNKAYNVLYGLKSSDTKAIEAFSIENFMENVKGDIEVVESGYEQGGLFNIEITLGKRNVKIMYVPANAEPCIDSITLYSIIYGLTSYKGHNGIPAHFLVPQETQKDLSPVLVHMWVNGKKFIINKLSAESLQQLNSYTGLQLGWENNPVPVEDGMIPLYQGGATSVSMECLDPGRRNTIAVHNPVLPLWAAPKRQVTPVMLKAMEIVADCQAPEQFIPEHSKDSPESIKTRIAEKYQQKAQVCFQKLKEGQNLAGEIRQLNAARDILRSLIHTQDEKSVAFSTSNLSSGLTTNISIYANAGKQYIKSELMIAGRDYPVDVYLDSWNSEQDQARLQNILISVYVAIICYELNKPLDFFLKNDDLTVNRPLLYVTRASSQAVSCKYMWVHELDAATIKQLLGDFRLECKLAYIAPFMESAGYMSRPKYQLAVNYNQKNHDIPCTNKMGLLEQAIQAPRHAVPAGNPIADEQPVKKVANKIVAEQPIKSVSQKAVPQEPLPGVTLAELIVMKKFTALPEQYQHAITARYQAFNPDLKTGEGEWDGASFANKLIQLFFLELPENLKLLSLNAPSIYKFDGGNNWPQLNEGGRKDALRHYLNNVLLKKEADKPAMEPEKLPVTLPQAPVQKAIEIEQPILRAPIEVKQPENSMPQPAFKKDPEPMPKSKIQDDRADELKSWLTCSFEALPISKKDALEEFFNFRAEDRSLAGKIWNKVGPYIRIQLLFLSLSESLLGGEAKLSYSSILGSANDPQARKNKYKEYARTLENNPPMEQDNKPNQNLFFVNNGAVEPLFKWFSKGFDELPEPVKKGLKTCCNNTFEVAELAQIIWDDIPGERISFLCLANKFIGGNGYVSVLADNANEIYQLGYIRQILNQPWNELREWQKRAYLSDTFNKARPIAEPEFFCQITEEVMTTPMLAPDGYTYEKTFLEAHLSNHGTSPITKEEMKLSSCILNRGLQKKIEVYVEACRNAGVDPNPPIDLNLNNNALGM